MEHLCYARDFARCLGATYHITYTLRCGRLLGAQWLENLHAHAGGAGSLPRLGRCPEEETSSLLQDSVFGNLGQRGQVGHGSLIGRNGITEYARDLQSGGSRDKLEMLDFSCVQTGVIIKWPEIPKKINSK